MAWWDPTYNLFGPSPDVINRLEDLRRKLNLVLQKEDQIMSALTDIQAKQAATDALIASVKADTEALLAKIAAFPLPGLTPEQQAAIDEIDSHAAAINTALGGVDDLVPPGTP